MEQTSKWSLLFTGGAQINQDLKHIILKSYLSTEMKNVFISEEVPALKITATV